MNTSISLHSSPEPRALGAVDARPPFHRMLAYSFQQHGLYFGIAFIYFFSVNIFYELDILERASKVLVGLLGLAVTSLLVGGVCRFHVYVTETRPNHPIAQLFRELWTVLRDKTRMSLIVPSALSMSIFIETYVRAKAEIVANADSLWDKTFTHWDRMLHFGSLPWQWLQPVLGSPIISFLININYNCWILVTWSVWMAFAYSHRHRDNRTRFLLSLMLIWSLGGTVAATALASAGPCYYDEMGWSPNPYDPLMAYLNHVDSVLPLWALDVQSALWQGSLGNSVPLGISAMPSMHNASSLLLVLAARSFGRRVRWALGIHALLVFVGSVHLGWHYAVDAYVAWLLTILAWYGAAPVARWWDGRASSRKFWGMLEGSGG